MSGWKSGIPFQSGIGPDGIDEEFATFITTFLEKTSPLTQIRQLEKGR